MAPLIVRADGYANKAVDVVEARFPYPFKAKPEEVTSYVRETRQSASDYYSERRASASKSIDDNVRTPAYAVAEGIDHVRHFLLMKRSVLTGFAEICTHRRLH